MRTRGNNSACALSFWNMGMHTPSRTPASSRYSSTSGAPPEVGTEAVMAETQSVVQCHPTINLADLQLPVSMEQAHHDLEQAQQTVLYQGLSYEVVAAEPPDAPLIVPFTAMAAPRTTTSIEPYVPSVLPGCSYIITWPQIIQQIATNVIC